MAVSVDLPLRYASCASESRLGLMVSLIWISISLSRVFNKKEERLIVRKFFALVWEGLPAFGIKITLTSSHLVGMWLRARQQWKMAVSQGRDISSARCSWAGKNPSGPGYLRGLKELIAHLMRSAFEMLSILWSSRFSSM